MLVTLADVLSHVAFQSVLSMYTLVCGDPGCFVADCYEAHDGHRFLPFLFVSSTCLPWMTVSCSILSGAFWKNFTQFYVFDTKHTIYELCLPSERGFGMCMDLADPVSSGKYSGTFVFTAPVAEPIVVSYTVPLNGCTIDATATTVTSYSSSADCPDSAAPM